MKAETIEKFDEIDFKIIQILQENSKLSYNKIARRLNIAVGTVYNRVKGLEKRGVLKGYTVIVDPVKAGYNLTVIILIQAEGRKLVDAEKELAKSNNVIIKIKTLPFIFYLRNFLLNLRTFYIIVKKLYNCNNNLSCLYYLILIHFLFAVDFSTVYKTSWHFTPSAKSG